jgi:hypothetical protein
VMACRHRSRDDLSNEFLSSCSDTEYHEFVPQRGRTAPLEPCCGISFRGGWFALDPPPLSPPAAEERAPVEEEVTEGNALSRYFFDPDGNRHGVCLRVDRTVGQPSRKTINPTRTRRQSWPKPCASWSTVARRPKRDVGVTVAPPEPDDLPAEHRRPRTPIPGSWDYAPSAEQFLAGLDYTWCTRRRSWSRWVPEQEKRRWRRLWPV